ncbi:DUF6002 family protein [Kitasatospora sp. NPDC006697]|uniref:DUF6002 family protein n=1 Tax=Kitasatospora sp. NPDC006697 TaxID=3364020 RepID=UPI00369AC071
MIAHQPEQQILIENVITRYYEQAGQAARLLAEEVPQGQPGFEPAYRLPPMTEALQQFLGASDIALDRLGEYRGRELALLNMMGNPGTRTTKTFASLLMVARAVHHIQQTGERIVIVTPSSANKATALRDAVWRAVDAGLVTGDQLRIVVVVPGAARHKLWSSPLSRDHRLRAQNPVVTYDGPQRASVKELALSFLHEHGADTEGLTGYRIWYTLNIANYKMADALRAVVEHDVLGPVPPHGRLHAHSVSSAFGLLGHAYGRRRLTPAGEPEPGYLLVQHLDTPDMVLHLRTGGFSRAGLPDYRYDPATGLYAQDADPHFPLLTADPGETLEPTFYTRTPVTAAEMSTLIQRQGGDGIVVSLHECLARYPQIRALLGPTGVHLPADPRLLREWSLVMALTGVLNAADRGLVAPAAQIVVHGSGSYHAGDFTELPADAITPVSDSRQLHEVVVKALTA